MNTRPALYRSTLIAAAVAIGCLGAAAAQAHDHGWRGHGEERGWHGHDRGWHEPDRGWREHDRDRGYGPRYRSGEPAWREGAAGYAVPFGPLLPPLPLLPPPFLPGRASVVVRLPF